MKNNKAIFVWIVLVFGLTSCFYQNHDAISKSQFVPTLVNHTPTIYSELKQIWAKENIFILFNRFDITLDSNGEVTCFIGDIEKEDLYKKIICFESKDGSFLWSNENEANRTINVVPNGVFSASSSPAEIKKYSETGKLIWTKRLNGTGVLYLHYIDDQIQISTTNNTLWILSENAETINKVDGERIFFITNDEMYIDLIGLRVVNINTKQEIWEYLNLNHLSLTPVFTDNKVFLRDGDNFSGSLYAFNRQTGQLLWEYKDIIGNPEYSSSKKIVYALHKDGSLLAINENTGEGIVSIRFSDSPFIFNNQGTVYAYQLAYNEEENLLIVYLGDSRQLFAFQEN